ncbi:hypothetical protein HY771_00700 [Candidatus Uhrbacteria bacterium]|nr:hypothetical protein [Candidatus Uhrbacteria bacterium]
MDRSAEVVDLCLRDNRIVRVIEENVKSSALAGYLHSAILASLGTLMVARLIIGALTPFLKEMKFLVSQRDVLRLGVHDEDSDVIAHLSEALGAAYPHYIHITEGLTLSLQHDLSEAPPVIDEAVEHSLPIRAGVSQDEIDIEIYVRIFLCALAMCKGVTINPRLQPTQQAVGVVATRGLVG